MKQTTIPGVAGRTQSGEARRRFTVDFVKMLVHSQIPMEKASQLKWFLEKYTNQGGTVPGADTLRRKYLPLLLPPHKEALKEILSGKKLYIVADESTDVCQRNVFVTLGIPEGQGRSYIIGIDFFSHVNYSTVSQAVIRSLNAFNVNLDDVLAFVSDNARYMIKAFNDVLSGLMPNANHVCCFTHILSLVLEIWPTVFTGMNRVLMLGRLHAIL